jgi:hypothetical protein
MFEFLKDKPSLTIQNHINMYELIYPKVPKTAKEKN